MGFTKEMINLVFPQKHICLFCKENWVMEGHICEDCRAFIELLNRKIPLELAGLKEVYYSVLYNRMVRDKIHAFKFQGKSYLYKPFGEILLTTIEEKGLKNKIEAIIAVPIHRRKKALRGYNQSELLGNYIANKLNKPLLKNRLCKARWTKEQNQLGKLERETNLKDSFKTTKENELKGKRLLLIDDIITTGATFKECSKTLIMGGAREIYGLAITSSREL